ncbi:MAG TPA: hypothetical protein PKC72_01220 [Chitinophagaceae bacterium]|nr:hypothetical protein [Chitinophagaceae bacterium]
MTTTSAQEFLFRGIKELLPDDVSMVDVVSEILHISSDSAYRRIRGETPLVLEEALVLCRHFHLSFDQLSEKRSGSILFQNISINNNHYSYEQYLGELVGLVKQINQTLQKEIIYLSKDVPLFHNFYFKPLIAFRYFFWMKSILQHPDFINREFEFNCVTPEIEQLSRELVKGYIKIPSTEIWNTESINSTISQIEFIKDSGLFSSASDIKKVYDALEESVLHVKAQAETGIKFMPGEETRHLTPDFRFFYNRIVLGDTTIFISADQKKSVYLNYSVLNYMMTKDEEFCKQCRNDLNNLMKRATLISQTGEKQRNIFFGILLSKIQDRKRNL